VQTWVCCNSHRIGNRRGYRNHRIAQCHWCTLTYTIRNRDSERLYYTINALQPLCVPSLPARRRPTVIHSIDICARISREDHHRFEIPGICTENQYYPCDYTRLRSAPNTAEVRRSAAYFPSSQRQAEPYHQYANNVRQGS
jgi:hypothetical protein